MPRAGWLAAGAVVAALGLQNLAPASVLGDSHAPVLAGLSCASVLAVVVALLAARPRGALIAAGIALVLARAALGAATAVPHVQAADPQAAGRATVLTLYAPAGGSQRALLQLDDLPNGARAYATLPRYPVLAPGDRIEFDARPEPAPPPESSGFAEFLARSGAGYTIRARSIELQAGDETPAAALEHVRRGAGDAIARALPEPQAGLAAAIVVGLRDLVSRDVSADFRVAGLSHIVAISGFHVALVAGLASSLLRPLPRRGRSLVLVSLLAAYALLTGASPSVLRASLMAGTVLLLRETGRRGQAAAALGLAVLGLLLVDPATSTNVGFQLSVAATAGLLRWGGPFADGLARRLPRSLPRWLVETLAVSLAAQLATLPLVLLHFGRLSIVAPLSNLLAAPLIAPSMAAAGSGIATGLAEQAGTPALVLAPVKLLASVLIGALVTVAQACASLPLASIALEPPLDLASAVAAAGLVGLLAVRRFSAPPSSPSKPRRARGFAIAAIGVVCALTLSSAASSRPDGRLHMTVLDVGQGDAILLVGPTGSRMLVDAGPDPDLLLAQLDARLPAWDRRLDLVVLTHPHEDHVAGLALLLDRYRVVDIAEPGMIGLGPGDAAFRGRLEELGRTTRILAAGDRFSFDGADVLVHWPIAGRVPLRPADGGRAVNNVSIVLEFRYGQRRFLLTGDVEQDVDAQLIAGGLADGGEPIDVLKVAHHGSGTASTDAFLERIRPATAIVSAGNGNPYGHPSPATVARLEAAGARVFRTDRDGSVHVSTNGRDISTSVGGRRSATGPPAEPGGQLQVGFCPLPPRADRGTRRRPPYNRRDDHPLRRRRSAHADRARATALAAAPLGGGGRYRGLPGAPSRAGGPCRRPAHRGARRPAA